MTQFYSNLSDENDQYDIITATHLCILILFLIKNVYIDSFFTTMSDHINGCTKQYHCGPNIYLLSYIALGFCIINDRSVGVPGYAKDPFDGMCHTLYVLVVVWCL